MENSLHHCQQNIDERILHPKELMRYEAHKMEISLLVPTAGKVKHPGLEHGAGVVEEPGRRQIQGLEKRRQLLVQWLESPQILYGGLDFRRPCRLRNLFEQCQTETA